MRPGINNLVVTLGVGDETHIIIVGDFLNFLLAFLYDAILLLWDDDVIQVERKTGYIRHVVTQVLNTIEECTSTGHTHSLDNIGDDATQGLLRYNVIKETYLVGDNLVDDDTADRSIDKVLYGLAVYDVVDQYLNWCMQVALAIIVGNNGLLGTIETETLALSTGTELGNIVQTEHHIL